MFNFSDGQTAITEVEHVTIRSRDRTQDAAKLPQ